MTVTKDALIDEIFSNAYGDGCGRNIAFKPGLRKDLLKLKVDTLVTLSAWAEVMREARASDAD